MNKTTLISPFKYLIVVVYIFLNGFSNPAKAQMVFMPDTNFRNALISQGFGSCISGNYIDSTCTLVNNCLKLSLYNSNISDLTGIEAFHNLTNLNCRYNNIVNFSILPSGLKIFNCANTGISTLPTLPNSLINLNCEQNNLGNISALPTSLKILNCESNSITNISTFPSSLTQLNCGFNSLFNLPNLPNVLTDFDCEFNLLSNLPSLPSSLLTLNCAQNSLTTLPSLPVSLTYLACNDNQISALPALPNTLDTLICYFNHLTTFASLPNSLLNLDCTNNYINSLPSLPPNLINFNCAGNFISVMPNLTNSLVNFTCNSNSISILPPLPNSLRYLVCAQNPLNNLPPLPDSLISLDCRGNLLTNLPTLPNTITYILCNGNQLTNLPDLPDSLGQLDCSFNYNLSCLPQLKKINSLFFTNTNINCLPNYGTVNASTPDLSILPLCGLYNSNGCNSYWNISGQSFFDIDSNCIYNTVDVNEKNIKINLYKNGQLVQQTFTGGEGFFSFDADSLTIFKTQIDTSGLPFKVRCPLSLNYIDSLSPADSLKYDRNFSLECNTGFDLAAWSINPKIFVIGDTSEIKISVGDYSNLFGAHCASGISGIVKIVLTGPISYDSPDAGALTPTSISGDTLTYNITDFGLVNSATAFNFIVIVDTSASIGSQVCITVAISPTADNNSTNNTISQCFSVVSSFDPNFKSVYPKNNLDINGDRWLNYTINFQNTGTAPAKHIYILDTLNSNLDLSTFQLVAYSHQPYVQILNGGIAKFNFPNINLPDSTSNEPNSHGYVQYRIKAKDSLAVGVQISNTAYIYFDFNTPVVTNTVSNSIINCAQNINNISVTICNGSSYNFNGLVLTQLGIYSQRFITSSGCDSVVNLTLNTHPLVTQSNNTLTASATNASYQWINCTTGNLISGAISQAFTPTITGSYAVIITSANCTDTSVCHTVTITGINENSISEISISPNPSHDEFVISCPQGLKNNIYIKVFDTYGKLIELKQISPRQYYFKSIKLVGRDLFYAN